MCYLAQSMASSCRHPISVCLFSVIALLVSLVTAQPALAQARPNILLIVADDIGYGDLGAFGGEIETPNIDTLAAEGVRFSNFHAASSCAPTRAMLLTGVDSHLAGVGSMLELMPLSHRGEPGYDGVLNDRVRTIASILQGEGYRTSIAGKWHLGDDSRNLPPARGFDYSVIQADSGADNFEMRPYLPMKPEAYWYENGVRMLALPEGFYSSSYFVDKTIDFLESTQGEDKPFFAYVAFQANHVPVQAPAKFIDTYRGRYSEGWARIRQARIAKMRALGLLAGEATVAAGPSQQEWDAMTPGQQYFEARRMQAYAGMATAMDYEIGRLLDYLRDTGEYENTVFLFMSDNGATTSEPYQNPFGRRWLEKHYTHDVETLGEKGSWVAQGSHWGVVSNTPLDGYKFYAGEGGVRVPLIISGLPSIKPGEINSEFVYVTDLAPTMLSAAGLQTPTPEPAREPMTGRSLLPLFEHPSRPVRGEEEVTGYEFSGNSALYRGDYKLVRNQPPVGDRRWRLYNIGDDPGETDDLSARLPDLYRDMQRQYDDWATALGVLPMPDDYELARQVMVNSILFFFLPRYLPYLAGLVLLVALYFVYRSLRRRRGA